MARILVIRHALLAKLDQLFRCNFALKPAFEGNIGCDCLTSIGIWHSYHASFAHSWMLVEHILYLTRQIVFGIGTPTDNAPEMGSIGARTPNGTACEGEVVSVSP